MHVTLKAGVNAVKCNLKELTTKSAWVPRSAVFSTRSSVADYIDHVIPWHVQFSLRAGFCRPFSSVFFFGVFLLCEQFVTIVIGFAIFRFSVCFFEGLVHMPRNTANSISASLDPSVPTSSDESALSTTSTSTSSSSFTSSPSSVAILA